MFNTDMTKMFDPQAITKNMQQMMDFSSFASNSKHTAETMKTLSSILADTWSTCTDKQTKMAQHTMEECVECMRDLSSAKSIEDYMAKQATWMKKSAEASQSNAQELANTLQKGQTQCTDIIGKMVSANMDWAKNVGQAVSNPSSKK